MSRDGESIEIREMGERRERERESTDNNKDIISFVKYNTYTLIIPHVYTIKENIWYIEYVANENIFCTLNLSNEDDEDDTDACIYDVSDTCNESVTNDRTGEMILIACIQKCVGYT